MNEALKEALKQAFEHAVKYGDTLAKINGNELAWSLELEWEEP